MENEYGRSNLDVVEDDVRCVVRHVDAPVRTISLIGVSAEFLLLTPVRVMQADGFIDRHPAPWMQNAPS